MLIRELLWKKGKILLIRASGRVHASVWGILFTFPRFAANLSSISLPVALATVRLKVIQALFMDTLPASPFAMALQ